MSLPVVLLLGPGREAMSGVSAHLNLLFSSTLAARFALVHFQVGSEGRDEGSLARLGRLLASPWMLGATILARRASIVHINTAMNPRAYWRDLAYMIVARLCGARVLYQVHGGSLPEQFFKGHRLLTAFLRKTFWLPSAIAVLARTELSAYQAFVPHRQVLLLPNGVECAAGAVPAHESSSSSAALRLVYIGRLAREKGLAETLHGMRLAHIQGTKAQLVIAGGGPEEASLRKLVRDLGLDSDVSFAGPVFGASKSMLLSKADALVLASYAEGLPYALLEGMAAGVPPIATPVGAIPDVVVDGVHGLLVAPRDPVAIAGAIRRLAADRVLLARMRRDGRLRIASAYSIDRLAEDLAVLYTGLGVMTGVQAPSRS